MLEQEESNLQNLDDVTAVNTDNQLTDPGSETNLDFNNSESQVYNTSEPFDNDYVNIGSSNETSLAINELVTGDSFDPLKPQPAGQPLGDITKLSEQEKSDRFHQYTKSLDQSLRNSSYGLQDPNQWGGVYKYNSGPNSTNYYERYHNLWGDGDYQLDFHPLQDNEAVYNLTTSGLERTSYALAGMSKLMLAGFAGTYNSLGNLVVNQDFSTPAYTQGEIFDRTNKLYYDSTGGTGAFVNNLVMNFGYTLGILGTIAIDGGFSAASRLGQTGRMGLGLRNLRAYSNMRKANQLDNAVDGARALDATLDQLSNASNARKWYQGWDMRRLSESTIGRAVNPFSNMTAHRYKILDGLDDVGGLASTSFGFGAFYRDLRNVNLAVSESRLESAMNGTRQFEQLYSEFYRDNGRAPVGDELASIQSAARATAAETSVWNTALIYFTNKLAFDNILNPTSLNRVFGRKIVDIGKMGGGKFGEVGRITMEAGKGAVFRQKGWRTWLNGWKTDPISKSLSGTIGYFKVNLLEGVQESMQEVIAEATYNHYRNLYYSDPVRKTIITKAALGEGSTPASEYTKAMKEQVSPEGAEVFASGFFMGFLSKGVMSGINALQTRSAKILDPKGYEDYVKTKTEISNTLVDRINAFGVKEFVDSGYFNSATQFGVNTVAKNGDIKETKDAEVEALVEHVTYLKKNKILDLYVDNFKSYLDLTDQEFMEAFPTIAQEDIGKYKAQIPIIAEKLKKVSKRLDNFKQRYPSPVDMSKFEPWMSEYDEAVFINSAWEESQKQAVFFNESWEDVTKRMSSIMKTHYNTRAAEGLSKSDSDLILTVRDKKNGMFAEINRLKTEIKSLTESANPESLKAAKERKKRLDALEEYYEAWSKFDSYFHRDRYRAGLKQYLQKEKEATGVQEEVTEEEVDKTLDKELGKKTVKQEGKLINDLKTKYKKLLTNLSDSEDFIFDDKVTDGFRDVIDFYKLSDEKAKLVKLINLVNDPQGFYQLYEKNLKWMKDLYNERGAYATEIVKREMQDIEGNALLNVLADEGIFMSGADFIAWKDHGIAPTEFYDEVNEMLIPEGTAAFDKYMEKLLFYAQLQETVKDFEKGSNYREYTAKIQAAKDKRDAQLEKQKELFKQTNGVTVEEFEKQNSRVVPTDVSLQEEIDNYKKLKTQAIDYNDPLTFGNEIVSQLNLEEGVWEDFLEGIDQSTTENKKLIKDYGKNTKLAPGISKEDKADIKYQFGLNKLGVVTILDSVIEELENKLETKVVSDFDNTPAGKAYSDAVKQINDNYIKKINEIESQYSKEDKVEPVKGDVAEVNNSIKRKQTDPQRVDVKWDTLDEELKDLLTTQFELWLNASGKENLTMETDEMEYLRLRNNWLKNNRDVIAKYNAEQEAKKPKTVEEIEVPTLKTLDGTVPSKLKQLDALVNVLNNDLKKAKTDARKEDIQSDINTLIKYREDLSKLKRPQSPSERNWRLFEAMVLGKQNQVERVIGENGETIGYRFTGSTPETPAPTRSTQYAEELKNKKFKLSAFEYGPVKEKNYNKKTGKTSRGGLLNLFDSIDKMDLSQQEKIDTLIQSISADKTYSQLQEPRKLATIKTALEANFTLDSLKKVVNRVAFRESNIAGNTVDAMFRAGLTLDKDGNFIKPTKKMDMSDEAFDSLNAIITELQDWAKDGDYFFYVGDALVFDQTAMENGVVGAMDIFAFNRKTKEFHIIDIKTSKNFGDFAESKMYQYSAQQSIYRNLVHNMMGTLPSKLSLLPIEIDISLDGYIKSAKKAGENLNKERITKLKAEKKKANKVRKEEIDAQIKSIQDNIAVDIPYIKDVEAGVPLVKPTDVPAELQAPVTEEGESFDPFLTEEIKEKLDTGVADQIEKLAQKIREAKDINEADAARMEAIVLVVQEPALSEQITKMLQEEVDAKRKALENVISPKDLSKGDFLVSENPIFDVGGRVVVVDKVYKNNKGVDMVTVKSIGPVKKQKSMPVSEANKMFDKATATDAKESIKVSKEAKAAAKKSQKNQKEVNATTPVAENNEGTGLSGLADKLKNYTKKNPKEDC